MTSISRGIPVFYGVMLRRLQLGTTVLILSQALSCTRSTSRGEALYAEGRFIEAAELFEHNEGESSRLAGPERARYGLYRGMTLLRLGDLDGSARWLAVAQAIETARPGSLEATELKALRQTHLELNEARSRVAASPDPLVGAVAHTTEAAQDIGSPNQ